MTDTQTQQPSEQPGRKRLLRSREERVLGGICGGLGRYFEADPILFRIGMVVLALLGGAGVVLYLAMLLLVPEEAAPGQPQPPAGGNRGALVAVALLLLLFGWPLILGVGFAVAGILFPLALLAAAGVLTWWLVSGQGPSDDLGENVRRASLGAGVLLLCCLLAVGGAWAAAAGGGEVVAGLIIAAAVALLVGAFVRPVRWLALPALVLALSAGVVAAAGIELDGGIGKREYRPTSAADVRDRYELGIGELVVDLRDVDLPPGDTRLALESGVGDMRLIVPEDVCVETRADIGVGAVNVFERENGGIDLEWQDGRSTSARASRLVVDANVGVGALQVSHHAGRGFDRAGFDPDGDDEEVGNQACKERGARR